MRQTGSGEVPDYAFYTCIPQQVKPDLGILYLGRLELPDQKWTYGNLQIYVVLCWCFYIWHLILRRPIWVILCINYNSKLYTSSSLFLKFQKSVPSGSFKGPSQNTGTFTVGICRKLSFFKLEAD